MRQTNRYYYEKYLMDNGIGVYGGKELSDVTVKYTPRYTDAAILSRIAIRTGSMQSRARVSRHSTISQ